MPGSKSSRQPTCSTPSVARIVEYQLFMLQSAEPRLPRIRRLVTIRLIYTRGENVRTPLGRAVSLHKARFEQCFQRALSLHRVSLYLAGQFIDTKALQFAQRGYGDEAIDRKILQPRRSSST